MKLKTKHITKIILIAVVFILCMPVLVSAKSHSYDDATVTTSSENPYSKVAITPQSSMFASIQIHGNKPGTFTLQDWVGNPVGGSSSVPDDPEAELYYPVTLGTDISYYNSYGLKSDEATYYVNVANNSDKFGDYKVSLVVDRYKLGEGDSIEIQMDSGLIPEVDITATRTGIHQIWYNDVALTPTIISPSGKYVNIIQTQLPNNRFIGGSTLGRYFYFAAFEIGKYTMTFTTGASFVTLRCEYFKSQTIRSGSTIHDGVLPGSSEILNPEYQKYVYEMNIDLLNYYVYSLDFEFNDPGGSNRRIFYESANSFTHTGLSTGYNNIYNPLGGSNIYIVIDTPNYFTWASPGVAESNIPKFSLEFSEIKSDRIDLDDSELVIVTLQEQAVGKFVRTRNPGVLSLQFESVGPNSPDLIESDPYIVEICDNHVRTIGIYENIDTHLVSSGNYSVNILISKGTYRFGFEHSGSGGNEYLRLTTTFTEAEKTTYVLKNPNVDLISSQFKDITLSAWDNMPDPLGATHGNALIWDVDEEFRHYGYNISLNLDKNPNIFNVNLNPDLEFLFDASTPGFVDYTGTSPLPIKTTGATTGDAFIIGAYDKFSGVNVALGSASDTDAFVWQYRSTGGWLDFNPSTHDFVDGSKTASGSLQQSGTTSWDPDTLTNWNYVQTTTNSTGTGVPDTGDRPLYLIRIYCNTSAATVPTVNDFTLKKFVKIRFDLNIEFGYDIGPLGDPYYDDTSGETEWASGIIVDNAQDGPSINDAGFGLDYNFNYQKALMFFSTEDMAIYNYNGSNTGVTEKFTADMIFSVAVYRQDIWIQQEYTLGRDPPATHSADINFTEFTDYGHTLNYNASDLDYAYVKLLPARNGQYDWSQITMNVSYGTVTSVNLYFPLSLTSYTIRTDGSYYAAFTGTEQYSAELGFITEYILMEFDISPDNADGLVTVQIYAGHFGYPSLSFSVSSFVWTWYYTVGAVGLVAIIGGLVAFLLLRKKKRGY
ncbi:MAG: hypothetical protein JW776_11675 [Candidatus Lokiarchaeota archaeon]|nr:hypothetical protein [Candidatus Lokiarchaeota archaeon]